MWMQNLPVTIISAITASAGVLCIYKDVSSGPNVPKGLRADGKTVIVTGANTGIGKEAAWEFANRGAKVFMACRDMVACEEARREIVLSSENKFVYCRPCDLASQAAVREFVRRFKSEEPQLDILVNSAGVMQHERTLTRDGLEASLGVNHFGHFLLTELLRDTLKSSGQSRVVVVSCAAHRKGTIHKDDLNLTEGKYDGGAAYNQSKLANVLFGRELARQLLDSKVSVSIVDPGFTDSHLTRNLPMSKSFTRFFIYPLFWPSMKRTRSAAQTIVYAALDQHHARSAGDYLVDLEKAEPSEEAQDFELAQWLWRVSEKWTKVDEHKAVLQKQMATSRTG